LEKDRTLAYDMEKYQKLYNLLKIMFRLKNRIRYANALAPVH